jgi:hypothetical protein
MVDINGPMFGQKRHGFWRHADLGEGGRDLGAALSRQELEEEEVSQVGRRRAILDGVERETDQGRR